MSEKLYTLTEATINQVLAYLGNRPYTEVRLLVEAVLKAQYVPGTGPAVEAALPEAATAAPESTATN